MAKRTPDKKTLLKQRTRVAGKAPRVEEVLRGTLRRRFIRCGKPKCHCRRGRGHGPFLYLSVTLGVGQTRQITINPGDYAAALKYVQNYHRMQEVLESVSTVNRKLLQDRLLSPSSTASKRSRRRR
jgi:hypothetical protein